MLIQHSPRIVLGLIFLIPGTLKLAVPWEQVGPLYGAGEPLMSALHDARVFALLATMQILCGLALLANRAVPLALVALTPILINIWLFHVVHWEGAVKLVGPLIALVPYGVLLRRHWETLAVLWRPGR